MKRVLVSDELYKRIERISRLKEKADAKAGLNGPPWDVGAVVSVAVILWEAELENRFPDIVEEMKESEENLAK